MDTAGRLFDFKSVFDRRVADQICSAPVILGRYLVQAFAATESVLIFL